jgi:hypothetical protein
MHNHEQNKQPSDHMKHWNAKQSNWFQTSLNYETRLVESYWMLWYLFLLFVACTAWRYHILNYVSSTFTGSASFPSPIESRFQDTLPFNVSLNTVMKKPCWPTYRARCVSAQLRTINSLAVSTASLHRHRHAALEIELIAGGWTC